MPPFMSLSHTFSPPTEMLPPLRELFVSPYSFLENRHVFFPLNPLNSVHLSHVKDNIPPVVVLVYLFSLLSNLLDRNHHLFLCFTAVTYILPNKLLLMGRA